MSAKIIFSVLFLTLPIVGQADVFDDLANCERLCSLECKDLESRLVSALRGVRESCRDTQPPTPPDHSVQIYHSDTCSSNLIANITASTQCSNLEKTGSAAWGVKANGVCYNIEDTSVAKACAAFSGGASRDPVTIFKSDSCATSNVVALVSARSQCELLSETGSDAWSIMLNGQCQNIDDTSMQNACERFSSGNTPDAVKFYHSDSCASGRMIAALGRNTRCESFSSSGSDVWAVEIAGRCENISDTNMRDACERFK